MALGSDLSPRPILDAGENYRGELVDLDAGRVVSADAFHRGRARLTERLASQGLSAGDRVVVCIGNGPDFVSALLAVLAAGGSPLFVHPKTPVAELIRTALRYGAGWILTNESPIDELRSELGNATVVVGANWLELRLGHIDANLPDFNAGSVQLVGVPLHPTSGTTQEPRVAVRPGRAAVEEARHYIDTIGVTADDTILAVAPMCHAYAYGMCVMVSLVSGARLVSTRSFQAGRVFQALTTQRISILPAVPAMLDVLMFGAGDRLRNCARCVLTAGSPLNERTAERFLERSGIAVQPLYGTTETGGITVAESAVRRCAGNSVGPPMQGVHAEIRRPIEGDGGAESSASGVGRLAIRSSSMMAGYLGRDGIDSSSIVDGWFDTGDLATIGPTAQIQLLGRETDMINVEGLKVIPCEVEEVIASLPGVLEVKVYAGRRRSGGQFVKAAVVLDPQVDPATIRAHCERNLVYYKRPERIIPVDALPRSAAGKIIRDQLP
jgi:acyl-CoA synthetase (AMP-forming)/AMP-acid ligase II